jgi:hypothetical protein
MDYTDPASEKPKAKSFFSGVSMGAGTSQKATGK